MHLKTGVIVESGRIHNYTNYYHQLFYFFHGKWFTSNSEMYKQSSYAHL